METTVENITISISILELAVALHLLRPPVSSTIAISGFTPNNPQSLVFIMASNQTETNDLISPSSIGHFGIRTTPDKFEAMVSWHLNFFGARAVLRNKNAVFIAWDDEHHRMVIVSDPSHEQIPNRATAATVYHIAFTLNSLADLATSYEQKKARGILPHWPVNHGMSTSMYYTDPDGNEFEMQVNNFDTAEEALAFMATPEYAENPIGVDIGIEDWLKRVRSGEDEAILKKRPVIGQRLSRYENSIYFQKPPANTA